MGKTHAHIGCSDKQRPTAFLSISFFPSVGFFQQQQHPSNNFIHANNLGKLIRSYCMEWKISCSSTGWYFLNSKPTEEKLHTSLVYKIPLFLMTPESNDQLDSEKLRPHKSLNRCYNEQLEETLCMPNIEQGRLWAPGLNYQEGFLQLWRMYKVGLVKKARWMELGEGRNNSCRRRIHVQ